MYARVSPEHKIRIVRAWQERGMIVAMTGDGVNDAPASEAGRYRCCNGSNRNRGCKRCAAMVLTDDNFATIVKAVENGRNLYQNIKYAIQFLCPETLVQFWLFYMHPLQDFRFLLHRYICLFINLLTDSLAGNCTRSRTAHQ